MRVNSHQIALGHSSDKLYAFTGILPTHFIKIDGISLFRINGSRRSKDGGNCKPEGICQWGVLPIGRGKIGEFKKEMGNHHP